MEKQAKTLAACPNALATCPMTGRTVTQSLNPSVCRSQETASRSPPKVSRRLRTKGRDYAAVDVSSERILATITKSGQATRFAIAEEDTNCLLEEVPLSVRAYEILAVDSLDDFWANLENHLDAELNPFRSRHCSITLNAFKCGFWYVGCTDANYRKLLLDVRRRCTYGFTKQFDLTCDPMMSWLLSRLGDVLELLGWCSISPISNDGELEQEGSTPKRRRLLSVFDTLLVDWPARCVHNSSDLSLLFRVPLAPRAFEILAASSLAGVRANLLKWSYLPAIKWENYSPRADYTFLDPNDPNYKDMLLCGSCY